MLEGVKLCSCIYNEKNNFAKVVFLVDEHADKKTIDKYKPRIERQLATEISEVDPNTVVRFEYRTSYLIEEEPLRVRVKSLLERNFSILTLGTEDSDIDISFEKRLCTVNLYLPANSIEFIRTSPQFKAMVQGLHDENFAQFEFYFTAKPQNPDDVAKAMERVKEYLDRPASVSSGVADKTMKVKSIEPMIGKEIQSRPMQIQHLRVGEFEQVIAGTIKFLKKRECKYKKRGTSEYEMGPFWTFVLNDGHSSAQCVFFARGKGWQQFEKLSDGSTICARGFNTERNGRIGFRVVDISWCDL